MSARSVTETTELQIARLWANSHLAPPSGPSLAVPYKVDLWAHYLANYPVPSLRDYHLTNLREGYPHGNHRHPELRLDGLVYPNLSSAFANPSIVTTAIISELNAGRYLGPFSSLSDIPSIYHPVRTSPLGVIPKKHTFPPKFRIIQHFSFPEGLSVNDGIDPDEYRIHYQGLSHALDHLREVGSAALMWKADVSDAFRTLPIHPRDLGMQAVMWLGLYFIDRFCPFGLRSAPFNFTSLMDLFLWIATTQFNIPRLIHFVDDFFQVSPPDKAHLYFYRFRALASLLGVPFRQDKFIEPCHQIVYVGFLIDAPSMSVSLPGDKKTRICALIDKWLQPGHRKASKHSAQCLLGHLMHVVQVAPDGRIFCQRLVEFITKFKSSEGMHWVDSGIRSDLTWWRSFLHSWSGTIFVVPTSAWLDLGWYTDASGAYGAGACLADGRWWALEWDDDHKSTNVNKYDIFWREMFAIWVSLRLWLHDFRGKRLLLYCDNENCVQSLARGRAPRHNRVNDLIRLITLLKLEHSFELQVHYVPSKDNPADPISRLSLSHLPQHLRTSVPPLPGFDHLIKQPKRPCDPSN